MRTETGSESIDRGFRLVDTLHHNIVELYIRS